MQSCPSCGVRLSDRATRCLACGYDLDSTVKVSKMKRSKQPFPVEEQLPDELVTRKIERVKPSAMKAAPEDEEITRKLEHVKPPSASSEPLSEETTQKLERVKPSTPEATSQDQDVTRKIERVKNKRPALPAEIDPLDEAITQRRPRVKGKKPQMPQEVGPLDEAITRQVSRTRSKRSPQPAEVDPLDEAITQRISTRKGRDSQPAIDEIQTAPLVHQGPVRRLFSAVLDRAGDPRPERVLAPTKAVRPRAGTVGWLPWLLLVSTLGLFVVVEAYNMARGNVAGSDLCFWAGILLVFVPPLIRLLSPSPSRIERVGLLCGVGICLYLVKVTLGPISFTGYDEFLHMLTANNILSVGHLFSKNTLLPVSPFFPGMEIVTNALSNLSGLTTIQSGNIVVGVARLLMVLALFLLNEQITRSARIASIATMLYMANPHFLFFDAQFAYESLALPLAIFVIFALVRYDTLHIDRRWLVVAAWIVLGALIVTHHLTNFIFEGLFVLWSITYVILRPYPLRSSIVILTTLVGLVMTVASIALIGPTLVVYFGSFFNDVWSEIVQALQNSASSSGGGRQLFSSYGEIPTPLWERAISLLSVGVIMLALPFSWLCLWRRYRKNPLMWVFGIMTLFYPVSLLLRLTDTGSEASDRSSAFLFLAISSLLAIFLAQFWPVRRLNWPKTTLLGVGISLIFMSSIILGAGIPQSFLPGPYQVSADERSIEPEGIQAAFWTHARLGPNNRVATDRVNQFLMATYGDQYVVTPIGDNRDAADVFFSSVVGSYETSLLQQAQIRYLVVDMRLSTGLPQVGFYIEQGEPDSFTRTSPMNRQYLTKFSSVPQINRLFDSGNIVIYDTGGLIHAPEKP